MKKEIQLDAASILQMTDPAKKLELPNGKGEMPWEVMGCFDQTQSKLLFRIARSSSQETKFLFYLFFYFYLMPKNHHVDAQKLGHESAKISFNIGIKNR